MKDDLSFDMQRSNFKTKAVWFVILMFAAGFGIAFLVSMVSYNPPPIVDPAVQDAWRFAKVSFVWGVAGAILGAVGCLLKWWKLKAHFQTEE